MAANALSAALSASTAQRLAILEGTGTIANVEAIWQGYSPGGLGVVTVNGKQITAAVFAARSAPRGSRCILRMTAGSPIITF